MKSLRQTRQSSVTIVPRAVGQLHRITAELLAVGLLLVVGFIGWALARQDLPVYDTEQAGFHAYELSPVEAGEQYTYRWTSGSALVQLPFAANAAPRYRALLRARGGPSTTLKPLMLFGNERLLATVEPHTAFRTYHLLLATPKGEPTLRFVLQTTPFRPPNDQRDLGIMVTDLVLRPLPHQDPTTMLLIPLALVAFWSWVRRQQTTFAAALLLCLLLTLGLLVLYVNYRPAPLPYLWLASLALVFAAIVIALVRETAARMALILLGVLVTFSGMLWPSWMTDDAFISFRYAQNLVAGHGLVYNVGERVEGYTNFLWTAMIALVLWLGGEPVLFAYLIGVLLALAIVLLTYWAALQLLGQAWALVATLIVATSQSLLVYTARGAGLETGLFTLLILVGSMPVLRHGGAVQRVRGIDPRMDVPWRGGAATGAVFGLATLTRPEGLLVFGLTMVYLLMISLSSRPQDPKPWNVGALVRRLGGLIGPYVLCYLAIFLPYFVWRFSYYGDLLPNTFYAKTGGGLQLAVQGLQYAGSFALALGGPLLLVVLLPLLSERRRCLRGWQGYLTLLVVVYSAYIISVGGDHFPGHRFFVPLVPWLALLIANGLDWAYRYLHRHGAHVRLVQAGLALLLFIYGGYALLRSTTFDTIIRGDDESIRIWTELGWWFHDHTAPDESIAAMGAGAIAYYSDRTTIDLLGLTERYIARMPVTDAHAVGHQKRAPGYVLDVRRPTYIPRMWDDYFGGEAALRERYTLLNIRTRYGREMQVWKLQR